MMPESAPKKSDGAPGNYAALISRLEKVMKQRPGDVQGLDLLARGYMRLGRYHDAWQTYRDLIKATGDRASAEQYASMAEAMVLAAGGYVSPRAERAIEAALGRDPKQATARYYHALAMAQAGHLDAAISSWKGLKADAPPDAPFMPLLDRTLAQAQALRGAGSPAPGPIAADMAAAQGMSPKQRQAMIEGMVSRLEQRLTTKGGTPEEWVRLMNAYVQLDRPKDAVRVAKLGIAAFGSGRKADFLRQQAKQMGLKLE
jgi:cytochrome c-type biogenesis protein CcmH